MPDSGLPWKSISPLVGLYTLASSLAMVLLPLPLSPASATISRSPMDRLTSSTACRVRRESPPPIWKCLVSPAVLSSGWGVPWSVTRVLPVGMQQAADRHAIHLVQVGLSRRAGGHGLRAPRREPAAFRWSGGLRGMHVSGTRGPLIDGNAWFQAANA